MDAAIATDILSLTGQVEVALRCYRHVIPALVLPQAPEERDRQLEQSR